ncbi:MAG: hypothetical protein RL009_118 [Actinomycetota bacterium]
MKLIFDSVVFEWRGPAPFYSYGWGVIPAKVTIGKTTYTTSLFPKDGGYLVPLKDAVRKPEALTVDDTIRIRLELDL